MAWRPHPGPQEEFCRRGEYEVFFGGAKGPGKTDCLIAEATRDIGHPRYHGLLLRRTFPRLQEIIDRTYQQYQQLGGVYRATEHRWYFPSGAKISLGHLQHEEDKRNYHGKEFHFVGFDELTEFTETQYLFVLANIRKSFEGITMRVRSTSNPGGIGHVWVKERFIDTCAPSDFRDYQGGDGEVHKMGIPRFYIDPATGESRCFVPATVYDNPSIMVHDPSYIRRLEGLPSVERMRLLHGVWDVFENQAFPELSQRVHGCDSFPVPPEWEKFCVMDWGYSKPFSIGWYALDFDGVLYRYREWYGCKEGEADKGLHMTPIEVARGIFEREKERVRFRVADPACWSQVVKKDKTLGPSITEDMSKEGIHWIKADNSRILGKLQVHERFKIEEELNEQGEITAERPRFLCFNDCKQFWRTVPQLALDVKNPEDVETESEDHCFTGETEILTAHGQRRIIDLVGTQGQILSFGGQYENFDNCRMTKKNADLVKVIYDDGSMFYCTPDHKFLNKNGCWIPAKDLTNEMSYVSIAKNIKEDKALYKSALLTRPHRNLTENAIGYAENISSEKANDYISQFGNIITETLIRIQKFTTKTTIGQTTASKILNLKNLINTTLTMPSSITNQGGWALCTPGPLSGMGVPTASNGIRSITQIIAAQSYIKKLKNYARHAENLLRESGIHGFAPISVSRNGDATRALTLLREPVLYAQSSSEQTDLKSNGAAQGIVAESSAASRGAKVIRVEPAGKGNVYCLSVENTHAFTLKNGAVVHNCYDEVRYAMMSRPIIPKRKNEAPRGTFAAERAKYLKAKKFAERHGVSMATAYGRVH